jgi:hypothetical protein
MYIVICKFENLVYINKLYRSIDINNNLIFFQHFILYIFITYRYIITSVKIKFIAEYLNLILLLKYNKYITFRIKKCTNNIYFAITYYYYFSIYIK